MKKKYSITLKDVKKACSEAVKNVPYFNKRRIIFSLTFPFTALLLPLLPFLPSSWRNASFAIPIVMIYFYFRGYGVRMYTDVKRTRYKHSSKIIPMTVELEKNSIIVEQEFIKEKIMSTSLFASMETDTSFILFPAKDKYALILIKKSSDNLSEQENKMFNRQIRSLLENVNKQN